MSLAEAESRRSADAELRQFKKSALKQLEIAETTAAIQQATSVGDMGVGDRDIDKYGSKLRPPMKLIRRHQENKVRFRVRVRVRVRVKELRS